MFVLHHRNNNRKYIRKEIIFLQSIVCVVSFIHSTKLLVPPPASDFIRAESMRKPTTVSVIGPTASVLNAFFVCAAPSITRSGPRNNYRAVIESAAGDRIGPSRRRWDVAVPAAAVGFVNYGLARRRRVVREERYRHGPLSTYAPKWTCDEIRPSVGT